MYLLTFKDVHSILGQEISNDRYSVASVLFLNFVCVCEYKYM